MKAKNNITKYIKTTSYLNNLLIKYETNNEKNIYKYTNISNDLTICSKFNQEQNF